jgi:hypothetical protein
MITENVTYNAQKTVLTERIKCRTKYQQGKERVIL